MTRDKHGKAALVPEMGKKILRCVLKDTRKKLK
jgi:hypothetical protein